MKEESRKSSIDFKEEEEYKNLPDFIKSMIGNFYNSPTQNSLNSNEQSNDSNSKNNKKEKTINSNIISGFNSINNNIISNNQNIKIFNIKDSNLSIMKKSLRFGSILQDNKREYMDNKKECSICFRVIINYGLLSNCDDIFCYECIKQWRNEAKAKNKREMFRRCPLCNNESPLLVKSKFYLTGEEKRKKMIEFKLETNNNINNNNN